MQMDFSFVWFACFTEVLPSTTACVHAYAHTCSHFVQHMKLTKTISRTVQKKRMKKKETTKNKHRAVKDMDVWLSWESRFQHKKYTQRQKQQQHHKSANFIIGSSAVAMVVRLKWKVNNPTMRYKLLWCVFTNEWLNDCQLSTIQC